MMPRKRYNDQTYRQLIRPPVTDDGRREFIPRDIPCGDERSIAMGLAPVSATPDLLVDPADYKEVIADCHARETFPLYHQQTHGFAPGWNQNGLGYCWAFGVTMAVMDARAVAGKPPVLLRPTSLGELVNWRNAGYYCNRAIAHVREYGIASAEFVPDPLSINPRTFEDGWQEDRLNYKASEWWDVAWNSRAGVLQQCLSILRTGSPLYVAFNWWGHALECVGLEWDESEYLNVVWLLRNSHAEQDLIELTGTRGVPDEAYGIRAGSLAE